MYVQLMKACVTTVLALFSLTPVWCDTCGAVLCGHCAEIHRH